MAQDDPQTPFPVAVVIPTVLRASLARAVRSVFEQDFPGRIQILIGVDKPLGDRALLQELLQEAPPHVHLTVIDPGYSTSVRHGGLYSNRYSGALRSILSLLANARHVAYLDDDNWFAKNHLSSLMAAIQGKEWAYSLRWYASSDGESLAVDEWESVGPGAGFYNEKFGGFVDTSSLMIDKLACHDMLGQWSLAWAEDGSGEDRRIFEYLRRRWMPGTTGKATAYYTLFHTDPIHNQRVAWLRSRGVMIPELGTIRDIGEAFLEEMETQQDVPARPGAQQVAMDLFSQLQPKDLLAVGVKNADLLQMLLQFARRAGTQNPELLAVAVGFDGNGEGAASESEFSIRYLRTIPEPCLRRFAAKQVLVDAIFMMPGADIPAMEERLAACWPVLRRMGGLFGPEPKDKSLGLCLRQFARRQGVALMEGGMRSDPFWVMQKL